MATTQDLAALRATAFQHARDVVEQWRSSGRRTTTAGVTSALKQAAQLDLDTLGIASNREFWEHVTTSGLLEVAQQPNGHWLLLLPGENLQDFVADRRHSVTPNASEPETDLRLKSDVWTSFVDWNPAFRRFWDSDNDRAFMVPIAPGWGPHEIDSTRFTEIEPARQEKQIGWMRTFADDLPEPDREAMLASLADGAPRGAFRRELRDRGLSRAWRIELRKRILAEAVTWAQTANIELPSIMDNRYRDPGTTRHAEASRPAGARNPYAASASVPASARTSAVITSASSRAGVSTGHGQTQPASTSPSGNHDTVALLRIEMHRIIDLMSWEELIGLPIRAQYLIRP